MDWWSNLWLNEGFATYMQYSGADFIEQHWRMMDLFVVNEMQPILKAEAVAPMHPLSVSTNSTHHLDAIFDRVIYSKGSSVIRMMVHFLTPKVFLKGIKSYLQKYRFKNAGLGDLFAELSEAQTAEPKVNLLSAMDSWIKVPGYPLLTVTRNYTNGAVALKQEPYAPTVNTENDRETVWHIPVTHTSKYDRQLHRNATFEWLTEKTGSLNRTVDSKEWLIVNVQRVGYYRVNYDPFNWRLLQSQLKDNPLAIHVLNRAQLIDDALDLAKHGFLAYDVALEFLELVRPDDDYMPWKAALDGIHDLDFLVYVKFVLENRFDAFTQGKRKVEVMADKALRKNPWRTMVVLCQGVRIDNGSHWQFVLDNVAAATTQEGKRAAMRALGCIGDKKRLKTHGTGTQVTHAIRAVVAGLRSTDRLAKMKKYYKRSVHSRHGVSHKVDAAFAAALSDAEKGLEWSQRHGEEVEKWLDSKLAKYPYLYEDLVKSIY
ncbi:hypothetical protein HPB48_008211 [Haemaphysalis longicornis]|uniref:Aminopeptidase N n=1 Tax=Haemaphysalis longicornis TaxID=44386 RepID=A0A9J6GZT4_HAELO|nr:hypothetical protein HPB48_008211 [Haemaphysalis longicornis]